MLAPPGAHHPSCQTVQSPSWPWLFSLSLCFIFARAMLDREMLDSRLLAPKRHPYGLVNFASACGDPQLFLQHEPFLDHRDLFEQGDNHGVAFIADRHGLVNEAMDRHPFNAHLFMEQRFVNKFLPFMHDLMDADAPCFHLALLDLECFDYDGDDQRAPPGIAPGSCRASCSAGSRRKV